MKRAEDDLIFIHFKDVILIERLNIISVLQLKCFQIIEPYVCLKFKYSYKVWTFFEEFIIIAPYLCLEYYYVYAQTYNISSY